MLIWTVISVGERQSQVRDASQPLSGGPLSIFSPKTTVIKSVIEAIGCFTDQAKAYEASEAHLKAHPGDRISVKAVTLDSEAKVAKPKPTVQKCLDCGKLVQLPDRRCQPCQQAFWQACRDADPELESELAQ